MARKWHQDADERVPCRSWELDAASSLSAIEKILDLAVIDFFAVPDRGFSPQACAPVLYRKISNVPVLRPERIVTAAK
jgi:hypothetical protein